jgi:hypothetical protein
MATFINEWNKFPKFKRDEALKNAILRLNVEIHNGIKKDYENEKDKYGKFFNEEFEKIMKLKALWDIGEISRDEFHKFTKKHVMTCWAFKYMRKLEQISIIKIQSLWRGYRVRELKNKDYYSSDWEEDDILEKTIYHSDSIQW